MGGRGDIPWRADRGVLRPGRTRGAVHELATTTTAGAAELLGRRGLSLPAGLALWWLRPEGEPRTMGELASLMRCSAANVTYLLDRLEAAGLVQRAVSAVDRRRREVGLTRAGVEVREEVVAAVLRDSPLAGLAPAELSTLIRVLDATSPSTHGA